MHTASAERSKLVTVIAGKWRRLLFAGNRRRSVYDKMPERYAEQNLIVRSGKSEAEITNRPNKRLCARGIVLLELQRGLAVTAELGILVSYA